MKPSPLKNIYREFKLRVPACGFILIYTFLSLSHCCSLKLLQMSFIEKAVSMVPEMD